MHLTKGSDYSLRSRTKMQDRILYSVGIVAKFIVGEIVHNIRVVDQRYTVLNKH